MRWGTRLRAVSAITGARWSTTRKPLASPDDMSRADPSDQRAAFDVAMIWTRIGATREAAGDAQHAKEDLRRAIAQFEAMMASSQGNANYAHGAIIAYDFFARSNLQLGDRAAALVWFRKSLALSEKLLATGSNDISARVEQVAVQTRMALVLAQVGDRAGALRMADAGVANASRQGMSVLNLAYSLTFRAHTYEALNDDSNAATSYAAALDAWKQVPGVQLIPVWQAEIRNIQRKIAQYRRSAGHGASHSPSGVL